LSEIKANNGFTDGEEIDSTTRGLVESSRTKVENLPVERNRLPVNRVIELWNIGTKIQRGPGPYISQENVNVLR